MRDAECGTLTEECDVKYEESSSNRVEQFISLPNPQLGMLNLQSVVRYCGFQEAHLNLPFSRQYYIQDFLDGEVTMDNGDELFTSPL